MSQPDPEFDAIVADHPELHMKSRARRYWSIAGEAFGWACFVVVVVCLLALAVSGTWAVVRRVFG